MELPQPEADVTGAHVLAAIVKYGMTAIAGFLLWTLATTVQANLTLIQEQQRHTTEILQAHIEAGVRIQDSLLRSERRLERMEGVLRQSCVNASKTYAQWQACWAAGEAGGRSSNDQANAQ